MIYTTEGVCSKEIKLEVENDIISNVQFAGGCNGNLKGIAALVIGRKPSDVIALLEGIQCGGRPTSCPDQLAQALRSI